MLGNWTKQSMPDLLVRDLDPDTYDRLRKTAEAQGKSLAQTAREMLAEKLKPSKQQIWAEIDRFRERIGPVSGDSTADIREDRDNDEPYR
jgi:plasmid stability protein